MKLLPIRQNVSTVLFFSLILFTCSASLSQPAFPGAEGFGSDTPGGRGGQIIEVTNTNASGPGSFRAACAANGPRLVVFKIGGTIDITNDITIANPFITIAGQTAPGDGICIKGAGLQIRTHDVVIRGLRVRVGDAEKGVEPSNRDGISIANSNIEPYNIIIDHCSVSWAIDGNIDLWYPCYDITIQWCIISEGLHNSTHPKGGHSTGLLVGDHAQQISVHHNLFAHNNGRNPLMKFDTETEVINNVIYNWGSWGATDFSNYEESDDIHIANIIGNYYKEGLRNRYSMPIRLNSDRIRPGTRVYVHDNIARQRPDSTWDDWRLVQGGEQFRVDTPAMPLSNVTISSAFEAFDAVLNNAGAHPDQRDVVDARIVKHVREKKGNIVDSQEDVGGWPAYDSGISPVDTDHDGMPDDWETARGLNPEDPSDAHGIELSAEGYTNIEVYINSFFEFITTSIGSKKTLPRDLNLGQNYPNPFNPHTTIPFRLERRSRVSLSVHNTLGGKLKTLIDDNRNRGVYQVHWNGTDALGRKAPSGIYFIRMTTDGATFVRKALLVD